MSKVDELKDRIVDMIDKGCTRFGWSVGPSWHGMTIEQKATAILEVWDAPRTEARPPKCKKAAVDIRKFVASLGD